MSLDSIGRGCAGVGSTLRDQPAWRRRDTGLSSRSTRGPDQCSVVPPGRPNKEEVPPMNVVVVVIIAAVVILIMLALALALKIVTQ